MLAREIGGILGQQAGGHHVVVEGETGFFVRHAGLFGFEGEFLLDLEANGVSYTSLVYLYNLVDRVTIWTDHPRDRSTLPHST